MRYRTSRLKIGREGLGEEPREEDAAYTRWYLAMNSIFGATVLFAIFMVLIDHEAPWGNRLLGSALILFLVAWFWFRGQWSRLHSDLDVVLYFAALIPLLAMAIHQHNVFGLILFTAYWQGFAYLRIPAALVYATLLTVATQVAFGSIRIDSPGDVIPNPTIATIAFIALVVSGLLASYIETITMEADRRAELLRQLREAQEELAAREREAGITLERQRLAGEIHDTVAQHFTSIVTNLEAADARAITNPEAASQHVHAARDAARQGIVDARAMVHALQPDVLTGRSIGEALQQVSDAAFVGEHDKTTFREEGDPFTLERLRETILVRALQEALNNARKHAQASKIDIALIWLDDEVILEVQDDGVGFDMTAIEGPTNGHRMGLVTMRQRVEDAGGTWMIESAPGEGTSLAISFARAATNRDVQND